MDILTIGLGTIGTTYSYLFNKAGHNVEHYIRKNSKKINITEFIFVVFSEKFLYYVRSQYFKYRRNYNVKRI